jgi:hypothetical protein
MVAYRRAGIGQYCLRLLAALAALPPQDAPGLRVTVLQHRKDPAPIIQGDRRFRRVGLITPPHNRWEQAALALELRRIRPRPTVLHSPDFIPPFHRPCPAVITVHDLAFLRFPELLTAESARYYGQIHRAVASAEAIIAVLLRLYAVSVFGYLTATVAAFFIKEQVCKEQATGARPTEGSQDPP